MIWKIWVVFGLMRNVTQIEPYAGKNAQKLEIVRAGFVTHGWECVSLVRYSYIF